MYIQDEKQKIVANLDVSGKWDETYQTSQMWTLVLILPQIGAYVTYRDESYVILRTETFQEDGTNPTITTFCTILPITVEGDDAGKLTITVEAGELTLI